MSGTLYSQPTRLTMSTNDDDGGRGAVAEDGSQIDEARLEAILKDLCSKAALLKKMGLGDEANKDHHPTPSGTNTGSWPPYPLGPLGWPGFIPPFLYGSAAPREEEPTEPYECSRRNGFQPH